MSQQIWLIRTCFGRDIFAVGSNEEVAKLRGINVTKIKFYVYIISGFLAALASRLQAGHPAAAQGYELNAIATVVFEQNKEE